MDIIQARGMAEMSAIASVKRDIFKLDPYHLIWGSIACRELWMWSDESGDGLGLDVTMKEAYSSGVGAAGLTSGPGRSLSESTLRDFPMTMEPLVHMPDPNDMMSGQMLRAHVYTTLCQMNTIHTNYFVFNNNQFFDVSVNRAVDTLAAEMTELLPALLSRRDSQAAPGKPLRPSPVIVSAYTLARQQQMALSAGIWEEEVPRTRDGNTNTSAFCARLVVVNSEATPSMARVVVSGIPGSIRRVATRIFGAKYSVNLSAIVGQDGSQLVLEDFVDGWNANVYEIGCPQSSCEALKVLNHNSILRKTVFNSICVVVAAGCRKGI